MPSKEIIPSQTDQEKALNIVGHMLAGKNPDLLTEKNIEIYVNTAFAIVKAVSDYREK